MDKIFNDAKDKNVSANIIYADDTYGYVDSAKEVKMQTSEMVEAFRKRALIDVDGVLYIPASLSVAEEVATVAYVKAASEGTAADRATITSVADEVAEG